MNTDGSNVVVASVLLSYNKEAFQALQVDLDDSIFEFTAEEGILKNEGKVIITRGKPTPGVNAKDGKIATIRFRAVKAITPQFEDIYFDFTPGFSRFSTVILDDKKGTDVLSETRGATIYVE